MSGNPVVLSKKKTGENKYMKKTKKPDETTTSLDKSKKIGFSV